MINTAKVFSKKGDYLSRVSYKILRCQAPLYILFRFQDIIGINPIIHQNLNPAPIVPTGE